MLIIDDIDPVASLHHHLPLLLWRLINYQQRRTNDAVSALVSRQIQPDDSCLTPASPPNMAPIKGWMANATVVPKRRQ